MITKEDRIQSEEEKSRIKEQIEEQKKELVNLAEIGRSCLENPGFKVYKKRLLDIQNRLIDSLIGFSEPDDAKYAMVCRAALTEIRVFKRLLYEVEHDAGMEFKKEEGK